MTVPSDLRCHLRPPVPPKPVLVMALMLALCTALAGPAQAQVRLQGDRAALERQRQALQADHAQELLACQTRFAVTACVDEARERHRVADAPLREALLQLDAQARRQRAVERQRAVSEKLRAAAARRQAASAPGP